MMFNLEENIADRNSLNEQVEGHMFKRAEFIQSIIGSRYFLW